MKIKDKFFKFLTFGGLLLELAFAYFMYLAISEAFEETSENYELPTSIGPIFVTLSIVLAVLNLSEDLLSVNPAEDAYALTHKEDEESKEDEIKYLSNSSESKAEKSCSEFCVFYPLKIFTLMNAYASFITGALADTIPFAALVPENRYLRWGVSVIPTLFGVAYYHMLSYEDTIEHNNFIFGRLLDKNKSVFLNILKSPLLSLEVLMSVGTNVIMRAGLISYALILFIEKEEFFEKIDPRAYLYFIGFVSVTTGYSTFFSRFIGTYKSYFNSEVNEYSENNQYAVPIPLGKFLFNCILRGIRSSGVSYFLYKYLPYDLLIKTSIASSVGLGLVTHACYTSYHRCRNDEILKLLKEQHHSDEETSSKVRKMLVTTINIGAKIAYSFALLASFVDINDRLVSNGVDLDLNFTDILVGTVLFSIPVSLNNFDYYNDKLEKMIDYYSDKIRLEKNTHTFGFFCCFFRSEKEYGPEANRLMEKSLLNY